MFFAVYILSTKRIKLNRRSFHFRSPLLAFRIASAAFIQSLFVLSCLSRLSIRDARVEFNGSSIMEVITASC